jgi:hypothetical protein
MVGTILFHHERGDKEATPEPVTACFYLMLNIEQARYAQIILDCSCQQCQQTARKLITTILLLG